MFGLIDLGRTTWDFVITHPQPLSNNQRGG